MFGEDRSCERLATNRLVIQGRRVNSDHFVTSRPKYVAPSGASAQKKKRSI